MTDSAKWQYIETAPALNDLCTTLRRQTQDQPWLALDTEFMREKTYFPQLCLVQIATSETVACIDPLSLDDLSPLLELIYDERITKVFHAAHQDLEIFYHLNQAVTPFYRVIFELQLFYLFGRDLFLRFFLGLGGLIQDRRDRKGDDDLFTRMYQIKVGQ